MSPRRPVNLVKKGASRINACEESVTTQKKTPYAGGDHFVVCDRFAWCSRWSQAKFCADQREERREAQHMSRSDRTARSGLVRQDVFLGDDLADEGVQGWGCVGDSDGGGQHLVGFGEEGRVFGEEG